MKKLQILSLCAAVTLALAACTSTGTSSETTAGASGATPIKAEMPAAPAGLEEFYAQEVAWTECGSGFECATITVPMDYDNPQAKSINLSLKKARAGKKALGSLLVNPGGPGSSGREMVDSATHYFSDKIRDSFDIVGFDPRGVGDSSPVDCLDDAELGAMLDKSYPDTLEGKADAEADKAKLVQGCKDKSGDLLKFVGTREAAKDMDVIRQVLGDPRLYYVGYSYGTSLGGMYAELFPHNVGRMILDGAVDTAIPAFEQTKAQAKGFERAFGAYLAHCVAGESCALGKTVDEGWAKLKELVAQVKNKPVPAGADRVLGDQGLFYGIIAPLYDDSTWFALDSGFEELINRGSGEVFALLFDQYVGREGKTFKNNMYEANFAITCDDTFVEGTEADWDKKAEELKNISPIFGASLGYSQYACQLMPGGEKGPLGPYVAAGSAPIVVVGTTGDPATPYEWGESFAKTLENSRFVTWKGEGHTAYGRAGDCINKALDKYLLTGEAPEDGLTCNAKE
ncbi:alpha/beta hydrolase [Trueperella pecoris]|uniref:alpha/beta hydrolase n=1 Tax=Trueperella pecoris TaxID=2733571 RepID=UPI001ABEA6FE|nr:alpha/beta hydrolase [Trueperella pecoris]QTG75387.1 alpha/beta fold hydrolase [Trueperella pecoris]